MATTIVNLTGHALLIFRRPPSGNGYDSNPMVFPVDEETRPAKVQRPLVEKTHLKGLPIFYEGEIVIHDLPPPKSGTLYITSPTVAREAHREDVLFPGPDVMDETTGRPIGNLGLIATVPIEKFYVHRIKKG